MAAIILKNLSIAANGFAGESALNLEIRDREFVVLTGPPGCGIPRILRIIAGLERSPGEAMLDDRPLAGISPRDLDIALVSRNYVPYPRMSVFDNLALGLQRRKFSTKEIEKRVRAAAEIMA